MAFSPFFLSSMKLTMGSMANTVDSCGRTHCDAAGARARIELHRGDSISELVPGDVHCETAPMQAMSRT
jgi:hypothetical protein